MIYLRSAVDDALYDWVNSACGNVNCVQVITFDYVPTAGIWTITLDAETTANIAYNAVAADVKSAIEAGFTGVTTVTVTGDYTNGFTITFTSPEYTDQSLLTVTYSGLSTTTFAGALKTSVGTNLITWIFDKQSVTRPTLPYGTINIIGLHLDKASPYYDLTGNTRTYKFKGHVDISINIYADSDYLQYMDILKRSLHLEYIKEQIVADGLFYRSQGDCNDLSVLVDSKFELRCQNDFRFGIALNYDEDLVYIDRISGTIFSENFDVN